MYHHFNTVTFLLLCLTSASSLTINQKGSSYDNKISRRDFCNQHMIKKVIIGGTLATIGLTSSSDNNGKVQALEAKNDDMSVVVEKSSKPYAPMEALLPATRLKIWTDEAYGISSTLSSIDNNIVKYQRVKDLNTLLSNSPKLFLSEKVPKRTLGTTAQVTSAISKANKDEYQMNRKGFNVGDKLSAMLNQADVERQWGMLQYAESKREEANEMRAALNFYTQQLNFGDTYQLTASKEERKKMIRNDEIPSLSAVITSDLDLRDLYRNEFLTVIEDAQAEFAYLVKQTPETIDTSDGEELMKQAYVALTKWFDLISVEDVDDAVSFVQSERR